METPGYVPAYARDYQSAGWHPLELPKQAKSPPPDGRTGYTGVDMTDDEVRLSVWVGNIGLRMPVDVIGLDIDAYRGGNETFKDLVARLGSLPKTWISHSSRNDDSGIRFFRVPVGMAWIAALPGIEIIQRGHRYAVVYPSLHPEGRQYGWWDQSEGGPTTDVPLVEDLPELPWKWIAELSRANIPDLTQNGSVPRAAEPEAVEVFQATHKQADNQGYIAGSVLQNFADKWQQGFSRHDSMQHCLIWAMECVRAGVAAGDPTVKALGAAWVNSVAPDARRAELFSTRRTTEFDAMLRHAVGKVLAKTEAEMQKLHDDVAGPVMNVPAPAAPEAQPIDVELGSVITFQSLPDPFVVPTITWHAEDLLCRDTHGEVAGAEKSLKSYIGLILDVGLAAGLDVFGRFKVAARQRVSVLIGEGGLGPFLRRLKEVCSGYGIQPGDLRDWFHFTVEHARINSSRFLDGIRKELETFGPALVHADPWYTYQPAATESSQLVSVGIALDAFAQVCQQGGATALLNHHFNRGDNGGLRQITGAGHAEWVDSWLLTKHRQPADLTGGKYWLRLDVGSRQWGGGAYDIDLTIAPQLGKLWWKVGVAVASNVPMDALTKYKLMIQQAGSLTNPMSKTQWLAHCKGDVYKLRAAFDELAQHGLIVPGPIAGSWVKVPATP